MAVTVPCIFLPCCALLCHAARLRCLMLYAEGDGGVWRAPGHRLCKLSHSQSQSGCLRVPCCGSQRRTRPAHSPPRSAQTVAHPNSCTAGRVRRPGRGAQSRGEDCRLPRVGAAQPRQARPGGCWRGLGCLAFSLRVTRMPVQRVGTRQALCRLDRHQQATGRGSGRWAGLTTGLPARLLPAGPVGAPAGSTASASCHALPRLLKLPLLPSPLRSACRSTRSASARAGSGAGGGWRGAVGLERLPPAPRRPTFRLAGNWDPDVCGIPTTPLQRRRGAAVLGAVAGGRDGAAAAPRGV